MFLPTLFSGCSYLVLQAKYKVFDKPGYVRILLSIYANKSRRSYQVCAPLLQYDRTLLCKDTKVDQVWNHAMMDVVDLGYKF